MDIKEVLERVDGALYRDSNGGLHVDLMKALQAALSAGLITASPLGTVVELVELMKLLQQAGLLQVTAPNVDPAQATPAAVTFHAGGDH